MEEVSLIVGVPSWIAHLFTAKPCLLSLESHYVWCDCTNWEFVKISSDKKHRNSHKLTITSCVNPTGLHRPECSDTSGNFSSARAVKLKKIVINGVCVNKF